MASRGVVNKVGVVTTDEYMYAGNDFKNASELKGKNGNHSLPDYSHSGPNRIYVKVNQGVFREMRVYGDDCKVKLEIAYHEERLLNNNGKKVLHYHTYGQDLSRSQAFPMTKEIYEEYKEYLDYWGVKWDEQE